MTAAAAIDGTHGRLDVDVPFGATRAVDSATQCGDGEKSASHLDILIPVAITC